MYTLSRFAALVLLGGISSQAALALSSDTCADEGFEAAGVACLSIGQQRVRSLQRPSEEQAQNLKHPQLRKQSTVLMESGQLKQQMQQVPQAMRSTPDGVCMYELPEKFNIGLLDGAFQQPEPQAGNISPISPKYLPPLQGMFDTNQFSLERIFFDRMTLAATEQRDARSCRLFYVPYFVAWETSGIQGVWRSAYKPELDAELLTHLTFYDMRIQVDRNHFIIIGRISRDVKEFLAAPEFERMVKFSIEDSFGGQYENAFGIPYPTWFRYYPALEPTAAEMSSPPTMSITGATYRMESNTLCDSTWLGDLTLKMSTGCNGRSWCNVFLVPPNDDTNASNCPVLDVAGTYSCGDGTNYTFMTNAGEVSTGRAVVLSCHQGPRWLANSSELPQAQERFTTRGPLVSFIGSIEINEREWERPWVLRMCQGRPNHCIIFDTGYRSNSSISLPGRQADIYQLVLASTFCLNAAGDSPTRKGLFDALVLGCIPVIFGENSLSFYPLHLPNWRSLSLLVTTDYSWRPDFNIVDYLEDYARSYPEEVLQKQKAIQEAAYSLQYSYRPRAERGPDGFDVVLQHLLSNKTSVGAPSLLAGVSQTNSSFRPANSTVFFEWVWRIEGSGDGICCYRIVDSTSENALYDEPGPTNVKQVAAGSVKKIMGLDRSSIDMWRIIEQDSGTFTITNVASGRQLFAQDSLQGSNVFGARGHPTGLMDSRWKFTAENLG